MHRFLLTLTIICLTASALGGQSRAHDWKRIARLGAQELSLDELRFIVRLAYVDERLDASIEDLQHLIEAKFGQRLGLIDTPGRKQSLSFEHAIGIGEGGAFSIHRERTRVTVRGADTTVSAYSFRNCRLFIGARRAQGVAGLAAALSRLIMLTVCT